ncbi:MAG: ribonuclease P protein component [Porphyromonas sp.]|nr:ribonuclease P protein component [Porphyromonas sp.]
MPALRHTFRKDDRVYLRDDLEVLFTSKESFISYPFRVVLHRKGGEKQTEPGVKVLVSVPKRKLKRAVERNLMKRRFREVYRREKGALQQLVATREETLLVGFIYLSDKVLPYSAVERSVVKALSKIVEQYEEERHE